MARKSKEPSIATARPAFAKAAVAESSRLPADDVIAALRSIEAAIRSGHAILAKLTAPLPQPSGDGRVAEALREDEAMELF